jgi:4-hydroxybenzoate polyprenyltransferase
VYLAGPVIVGVSFGANSPAELVSLPVIGLFLYFLVPANVYLYGVNDIFDAEIDRLNPKKGDRELQYQGDRILVMAVLVSGLLGLSLLTIVPKVASYWLLGFLLLGGAYSAPPLRLKTRPPFDSLSNGLYILPGAAAYATLSGGQPPALAIGGAWLWAMAMHTFSAIPDIEPDREGGIETLATKLGEHWSLWYCGACWLGAAGAFGLLDFRAGLVLGVYPVLVGWYLVRDIAIERAYWWYPAINTLVGASITLGGLWGVFYA